MTDPEAEKIARDLTEPQQFHLSIMVATASQATKGLAGQTRVFNALVRKGLAIRRQYSCECFELSDLGRRVAEALGRQG